MKGVTAAELATPAEDAQAIALVFREALEVPERTSALVTPDRALALHLSYLLTDPAELATEPRDVSDEKLFVLRPFVFAAHKVSLPVEYVSSAADSRSLMHTSARGSCASCRYAATRRASRDRALRRTTRSSPTCGHEPVRRRSRTAGSS